VLCLDIRLANRGEDGSRKTEGSERKEPLHPARIAEGFLEYCIACRKMGRCFPDITPDRSGSRAGNGTKTIGRWIRELVGITDPRKAPNHTWRHYFKSVCRDSDIDEEYHDALSGHKGEGSEDRCMESIMFGCSIGRFAKSRARFRLLKSVASSLRTSRAARKGP
jgi:integrase